MRARGVPMRALCEPPEPVQVGRFPWTGPRPVEVILARAGCHSRGDEMRGAARRPRYRVLAAGVAVAVALCLSLAGTLRVVPVRAMPGSHVVRVMALVRPADDNPGCPPAPGPGRWDEFANRAHSAPRPGLSRASASMDPGQPGDRAALIRALGADRVGTGSDMACPPAYRGLPVRHLPVSSWWRFPRVRSAIVTLTARTQVPGPHAGSEHGSAISDHGRDGTKRPGAASGDRGPRRDQARLARRAGPSGQPGRRLGAGGIRRDSAGLRPARRGRAGRGGGSGGPGMHGVRGNRRDRRGPGMR
jgi:hypothetical protein